LHGRPEADRAGEDGHGGLFANLEIGRIFLIVPYSLTNDNDSVEPVIN
jgi:hypothetical protein